LPPVSGAAGVTASFSLFFPCAPTCCTNDGAGAAAGVTGLEADGGPLPTAFDAVTVNVYVVPFVRPPIVTLVAGGVPDSVVAG